MKVSQKQSASLDFEVGDDRQQVVANPHLKFVSNSVLFDQDNFGTVGLTAHNFALLLTRRLPANRILQPVFPKRSS